MEHIDTEKFKRMLLKMKKEHSKEKERLRKECLHQSTRKQTSNLSAYPLHTADISGDAYEQEKEISLVEGISNILYEIDEALYRIDTGKYGICERCKREIPRERLEVIPFARHCISCFVS